MDFTSCGKVAYIPAKEAHDEAERMRDEWDYPNAHAYECPYKSAKGTAHWHVTSGRSRAEKEQERWEARQERSRSR